jgi:membrane protein YdbS with pleckstrin-like domain
VERPGNMPGGAKLSVVGIGAPEAGALPAPKAPPTLFTLGSFFLPHSRVVSENGNITYRRHPVQLLQTAGLPMLSILLYLALVFAMWRLGLLGRVTALFAGSWLLWGMGVALLTCILLILVVWFVFRYEDWRNDMFVLTRSQIIDIDRTPFGWQGVKQNVSPLDKVQNVTSNQDGFIEWFFDMGDVIIETGGEKPIIFERVKNPRQIQRDVADNLAKLKAAEKAADVAKRNQELAEWISIYNEMLTLPYDRKKFTQP